MTNEEAIEVLKELNNSCGICGRMLSMVCDDAKDIAINSIQENTKLKAENEQLNGELGIWQSTNFKLVCELTRIECENNQLKAELEQSVKLPCKVGDVVYIVPIGTNDIFPKRVIEFSFLRTRIYMCFFEIYPINTEEIGKTIFLSREEAEQHLKGGLL